MSTKELELPELELLTEKVKAHDLVVFNDDINTFDHVIQALMSVCKHEVEQAEQCTWIIHFKGKCQVKTGEYDKLTSMCSALLDRGISAEVQ